MNHEPEEYMNPIQIEVTVHHHLGDATTSSINDVLRSITKMADKLDAISAQVASNTSVIASAVTLINGIAAQITAAGVDPVKLQALVDSLTADDTTLAAAVAANTPAAPTA